MKVNEFADITSIIFFAQNQQICKKHFNNCYFAKQFAKTNCLFCSIT